MKRFFSILLCLLMTAVLAAPVSADAPKIVDRADTMSEEEISRLEAKAQAIADQYDMDVVIVTIYDLDGADIVSYADDYYDDGGYGIGENYSGVLLLIALDSREWAISTCGNAIYALTDYGMELLFDAMDDYLAEDDYYRAFDAYLDELPEYFKAYENGAPIDGYPDTGYDGPGYIDPSDRDEIIYHPDYDYDDGPDLGDYVRIVFVSLLIGAAVGGVAILIMRGQMNTAKKQTNARNYLVSGTYNLRRHQDIFLYSRVSRTRRSDNSHSGGHRGGSSVHRSSSGRSHGGRHGRF